MEKENHVEPVVITSYKRDDDDVVVRATFKETEDPVILEKKKVTDNVHVEVTKNPTVHKVKLCDMAKSIVNYYKANGYEMNENRAMCFMASLVSSRLLFLNSQAEETIDLLFSFFDSYKNISSSRYYKSFNASDALKGVFASRYHSDSVNLICIKSKENASLNLFKEHIINPYLHNNINVDMTINNNKYKKLTIPENVWIIVLTDDDHQFELREYGSYAKISARPTTVSPTEHINPSYLSVKDAFLDLGSIDEDIWSILDDIISILEKKHSFTNRELNMIDDYLVALLEMGMDYKAAIDFTVINKISYITGDEAIGDLKNYKNIDILTHTKKKAGKY